MTSFGSLLPDTPGDYKTPQDAGIATHEVAVMSPGKMGITDAQDARPVVAARDINTCTAIFLYDPVHHIAAVGDQNAWSPKTIRKFVELFPKGTTLEAHIIGGFPADIDDPQMEGYMGQVFSALHHEDYTIRIKTLDVLTKPHPIVCGVDSRNGQLIRFSRLCQDPQDAREVAASRGFLLVWDVLPRQVLPSYGILPVMYDGRSQQQEKKR